MSAQNQSTKIVVVGATGNVGRKIVELLLERNLVSPNNLACLASKKSAGKTLSIGEHRIQIQDADTFDFNADHIYLFATESDISKHYIDKITSGSSVVIDSSSLLRLDADVPLIVGPVNKHLIAINSKHRYAIANCVASPVSIVLAPLHAAYSIKTAHITTYQSVSGAGKQAMDELYAASKHVLDGEDYQCKEFLRQIAFNVIPQIGSIRPDGFTSEEFKIMHEIRKILGADFPVCANSVRVPVLIGHSCQITLELDKEFELDDVRHLLSKTSGIKLSENDYTTPIEAAGQDDVYVGRIKRDPAAKNGLLLWTCSDNLRRGAAVDAIEVAEEVIKQKGV